MNDTATKLRQSLKRALLGSATVRQYCPVGLTDPQPEVSVFLHGLGAPRDVTGTNVVASTRPLTLGVGLEKGLPLAALRRAGLSLKFFERHAENRLLGEIGLRVIEVIPLDDGQLFLFEPHHARNYCVARPWLWMRYLFFACRQWRARRRSPAPELRIPAGQLHCLFVFYTCPRPVALVSVMDANLINMVPMDLIGPVSPRCFSLALHSTSTAAPLIENSRRIALSSVPSEQAAEAYRLGKNHKDPCAGIEQLSLPTTRSAALGLPVPQFAVRVREMQIDSVRTVGSYKLFLAHTIEDRWLAAGPQFFLVHGFHERLIASHEISLPALSS